MTLTTDDAAHLFADAAGTIRYWSAGAEALFGYPAAEMIGAPLEALIVPEHRAGHRRGFGAALARVDPAREDTVANIPIICADGQVRAFPGRLIVASDAFHRASGVLAVFVAREGAGPNGLYDLFPEVVTAG